MCCARCRNCKDSTPFSRPSNSCAGSGFQEPEPETRLLLGIVREPRHTPSCRASQVLLKPLQEALVAVGLILADSVDGQEVVLQVRPELLHLRAFGFFFDITKRRGKLLQSFGLNGYGTSASLLLTCICTSAALLSDNGGSGLRQTHTNCIDVNTPDYVGLASTAFNMSARTVCKQQR